MLISRIPAASGAYMFSCIARVSRHEKRESQELQPLLERDGEALLNGRVEDLALGAVPEAQDPIGLPQKRS